MSQSPIHIYETNIINFIYVMSDRVNLAMIVTLKDVDIEISFTKFNVINLQPESDEVGELSSSAGE